MFKKILIAFLLLAVAGAGGAAFYFKNQSDRFRLDLASSELSKKELENRADGTSQELRKVSDENSNKILNLEKEKEALQQGNDKLVNSLVRMSVANDGPMELKLARAYEAKEAIDFDKNLAVEFIGKVTIEGEFKHYGEGDMSPDKVCLEKPNKKTAKLLPTLKSSDGILSAQAFCFKDEAGETFGKRGEQGTLIAEIDNFIINKYSSEVTNIAELVKLINIEIEN